MVESCPKYNILGMQKSGEELRCRKGMECARMMAKTARHAARPGAWAYCNTT